MNLIEEAEALLLHQFSGSPKFKGLIRALVEPFQALLEQIEALHHGGYIDQAYGGRLDILGAIVGQPRRAMEDEDYRAWIDVGIKLNKSAGTGEDVLAILNILYRHQAAPNFLMEEQKNDVIFTLFKRPMAPFKTALDIVKSASPVCITCHFICADGEPSFRFDKTSFESSSWAEFFKDRL